MDLNEAIEFLKTQDAAVVVSELQKSAEPIYRDIFNAGHTTGVGASSRTLDKMKADLESAANVREAAETQLAEYRAKQPDVATVTGQFTQQISDLNRKHKDELSKLTSEFGGSTRDRATADLRASLVSLGVDPDYAEVLVKKDDNTKRIKVSDDGRGFSVLQAGKEIPIPVDDGQSAIRVMAEELRKAVPDKFVVVNSDRGSGAKNGSGGGGKSVGNHFDKIREDAKARAAEKGDATNRLASVHAALGMSAPK